MSSLGPHNQPQSSPSHRKHRLVDSDLERFSKRRATEMHLNSRFDDMIGSMSASHGHLGSKRKNKKRAVRSLSHKDDAYRLPAGDFNKRLSLIKTDERSLSSPVHCGPQIPSDSAQVFQDSKSPGKSCNLPDWLIHTFMSLSKNHRLRLLLPSDVVQSFPCSKDDEGTESSHSEFTSPPRVCTSDPSLHVKNTSNMVLRDFELPIPYSTPGPGSCVGSTSKTSLSAASLQTSSSPTLFDIESQRRVQFCQFKDQLSTAALRHHDYLFTNEQDSPLTAPHVVDNPYISHIYATPGPVYRAPAVQLDTVIGGSTARGPEAISSRSYPDENRFDFHWHPFDRKSILAGLPDNGKNKTYSNVPAVVSSGHSTSRTCFSDQFQAKPVSPSPFSFSPPEEVVTDPDLVSFTETGVEMKYIATTSGVYEDDKIDSDPS